MLRIHSTALKHHTTTHVGCVWVFRSVSVVLASGKRPVPFRTRKLSLTAPMVLQPKGCGRVGHRRTQHEEEEDPGREPETVLPGSFSYPHPRVVPPGTRVVHRGTRVVHRGTRVGHPSTRAGLPGLAV